MELGANAWLVLVRVIFVVVVMVSIILVLVVLILATVVAITLVVVPALAVHVLQAGIAASSVPHQLCDNSVALRSLDECSLEQVWGLLGENHVDTLSCGSIALGLARHGSSCSGCLGRLLDISSTACCQGNLRS